MDLDPRYLQAFYEVGRARSFSAAATHLHKTQPAVSYQIGRLEDQLGTRVFDRTTQRLSLTPAGERLYELCRRFFDDFARLAAALVDPAGFVPEPLRIGSVSAFGRNVLFPILAKLPPPERYALRFPTADAVLAALHDASCDVGFVYVPLVSSRLRTAVVWHEELVLIAPPGTPRRLPRRADDLAALPFVTYDECEYVFGTWCATVYGRQPRSLRASYHFEELEEVVATVAAGRGWSIVPDHAAGPRVTILRHPRRRVRNAISIVSRAGAPEHPTTALVLAALRSASST